MRIDHSGNGAQPLVFGKNESMPNPYVQWIGGITKANFMNALVVFLSKQGIKIALSGKIHRQPGVFSNKM